jgi:regulator of replication initiation timing
LAATLCQLRDTSDRFEHFVCGLLDDLQGLWSALEAQQVELRTTRQELGETRRRLEEQGAAEAPVTISLGDDARLAECQRQWEAQRAALTAELESLRQQGGSGVQEKLALERELAATRRQLEILQGESRELAETRAEIARLRAVPAAQGGDAPGDPEAQARLAELEEERTALEAELEVVRQRAAELAEEAADHKRQLTEERAEWSVELRQLRRALEQQTRVLEERRDYAEVACRPSQPAAQANVAADSPDPILGSVMAQFESIQKDMMKRRAKARAQA